MNKIGFIGLGTMGAPMVRNLLKKGYQLTVYNRNTAKTNEFQGQSQVQVAASPAEVVQLSEVVITMLANDQAIEEVYFGSEGIMQGVTKEGSPTRIVIDSSTISPGLSMRIAATLAEANVDFLDAPVTGSEPQAIEGSLTFLVGGKSETLAACTELLLAMGKKTVHMGKSGSGSNAKLANNTLGAINLLAVAESIRMVQESGGDPLLFLEAVAGGGARSGMAEIKGPKMLELDFSPKFSVKLQHKDLGLAVQLVKTLGLETPMLQAAIRQFQAALEQGFAEEDVSAVYKLYK
ncbi:NAD(P)-dependent oxidoreductase [Paenibacillus koleovorans]|uniref:NAD(P)-dependent oxidoreductase n=1 Tax=Paenibacillus koleovorans TaxID=121608 RepID=UPI000FD6E2DA|nr:NAD(P)-dependent oxidoreductase [Paenibacillus koleovorans]